MRYSLVLLRLLAISLFLTALTVQAEYIAKKSTRLLSNNFEGSLERHELVDVTEKWQRRISYGEWLVQRDGSIKAVNVPEHGHGPVLTFLGPIKNVTIQCEFQLPTQEGPDRHFRIFLDHPDYRGHTIQAWANLSTTFRPEGITLQHIRKDKDGKTVEDIEFGQRDFPLKPGAWYEMRLELFGDLVQVTVDGVSIQGRHTALDVEKFKIGLNFGKAGGAIRNFRVWQAVPKR
ncbi:MAG: hypothetical protein O7C75_08390 [Verrucomicrobia bacterium]|nr:hypothetical protein [Verrucomicrobiota bacterium]